MRREESRWSWACLPPRFDLAKQVSSCRPYVVPSDRARQSGHIIRASPSPPRAEPIVSIRTQLYHHTKSLPLTFPPCTHLEYADWTAIPCLP